MCCINQLFHSMDGHLLGLFLQHLNFSISKTKIFSSSIYMIHTWTFAMVMQRTYTCNLLFTCYPLFTCDFFQWLFLLICMTERNKMLFLAQQRILTVVVVLNLQIKHCAPCTSRGLAAACSHRDVFLLWLVDAPTQQLQQHFLLRQTYGLWNKPRRGSRST